MNQLHSTTNPHKVIYKYRLLPYVEDIDCKQCHVPSPQNLKPYITPLPKFEEQFLRFSSEGVINTSEHLNAF
jgi:hypothetical protein